MAPVPCPQCDQPAEVVTASEQTVTSDALTLRVLGIPVARCPEGHASVLPATLASRIVAEVDQQVVSARRRRLRRDQVCGACDTALTLPPRRTDTPVPLLVGPTVVTTIVEAPLLRCPACGTEQLPVTPASDLAGLVDAAVDRAIAAE